MAQADRFRFNVGDRVKDRQTGEQGRISDISFLLDGALLVTVAVLVGGVVVRTRQHRIVPGQAAGLPIEKVATTVGQAATAASITHPAQGATISAAAKTAALKDRPLRRSILDEVKRHLDASRPKFNLVENSTDPTRTAEALYDQIQWLRKVENEIFFGLRPVDEALDFLVARDMPQGPRAWTGGYLASIVYGRRDVEKKALDYANVVERVLRRTKVPREILERNKQLIPHGIENAYDLLVHASVQAQKLGYQEGGRLFNRYGGILVQAVRSSPEYRRTLKWQQRVRNRIELLDQQLRDVPFELGYASAYGPLDSNTIREMEIERAARKLGMPLSAHFEAGYEPGLLDLDEINAEMRYQGARRWYQKATGTRPISRLPLTDSPARQAVSLAADPLQVFSATEQFTRRIVTLDRIPYELTQIDPVTRHVILRPAGIETPLFTPDLLLDDDVQRRLLREIAAVPEVAQPAAATAAPAVLQLRGGLLGHTEEAVGVPMGILESFVTGAPPRNLQEYFARLGGQGELDLGFIQREMMRLGFAGNTAYDVTREFEAQSAQYAGRLESLIRSRINPAQLAQIAPSLEPEDLIQEIRLRLIEQVRTLPHGATLGQVEAEIAQALKERLPGMLRRLQTGTSVETVELETPAGLAQKIFNKGEDLPTSEALLENFADNAADVALLQEREYQTIREFRDQIREYQRLRRQGVTDIEAFNQLFRNLTRELHSEDPARVRRALTLAAVPEQIAELLRDPKNREAAEAAMARFAEQINVQLFEGSKELQDAYRQLRWLMKQQAAAQQSFVTVNTRSGPELVTLQQALASVQRRWANLRNQEIDALQTAAAQARAIEETAALGTLADVWPEQKVSAPLKGLQEITAENERAFVERMNALLDLAEERGIQGELSRMGVEFVVQNGRLAARIYGDAQRRVAWIYERQGPNAGIARLASDPSVVRVLGAARDVQDLAENAWVEAAQSGRLREVLGDTQEIIASTAYQEARTGAFQKAQAAYARTRALQEAFVPTTALPIYQSAAGQSVGFYGGAGSTFESVRRNLAAVIQGETPFIGLDIEADVRTGRILNVAASQYQVMGDRVVRTQAVDAALPAFWKQDQAGGFATMRETLKTNRRLTNQVITKAGQRVGIGQVVLSERELISQVASFLEQNQAAVVGHNIAFDIQGLIARAERWRMTREAEVLRQVARERMADTLLLAQAAVPGQRSYALEDLTRNLLGVRAPQTHVAGPDEQLAAQLLIHLRQRGEGAAAMLASARQISLGEGQFLWNVESGRAYQLAGILDPNAAKKAFQELTGERLEIGVGIALRPIDFITGQPGENLAFDFAATPHGFAGAFLSKYQILDQPAMAAAMTQQAQDLARRRIRRYTSDKSAFTRLLREREYLSLANQVLAGEDPQAVLNQLMGRLRGPLTASERRILRGVPRWAERYLSDSRILRQLQLEREFWDREISGLHRPVIDWLEEYVRGASTESVDRRLQQANAIWNRYMGEVQEQFDFARITGVEVPLSERQLSLRIDLLGKNRQAIRIGSEELARRDIQRLSTNIAARLLQNNPEELRRVAGAVSDAEFEQFARAVRYKNRIIDTPLGSQVEEYLWNRYLRPAMAGQGFLQMRGETGDAVRLTATQLEEAIPELVAQGRQAAQQFIEQMPDPLAARNIDPDALSTIQRRFAGRSVGEVFDEVTDEASVFRFGLRHRIPHAWVGQSVEEVLQDALRKGGTAEAGAVNAFRFAAQAMSPIERGRLEAILSRIRPSLIGRIFQQTPEQMAEALGNAVQADIGRQVSREVLERATDAGRLNAIGMRLADDLAGDAAVFRNAGLAAIGILAGGALLKASIPPQGPSRSGDRRQSEGIASTDTERRERQARVLNRVPATHRLRVTIAGEDPVGISPDELAQSIHDTLSGFMETPFAPSVQTTDTRKPIDRSYLEELTAQILSSPGA